jgi:hypothetical protein
MILTIATAAALALAASSADAQQLKRSQRMPAAPFVEFGRVELPSNVPTEVLPARASRRLAMLSSRPNVNFITIGDETLTCGSSVGFTAFTADAPFLQIVEVPTASAIWACGNGVNTAVSFIEYYD